jgi:hypothetical protein
MIAFYQMKIWNIVRAVSYDRFLSSSWPFYTYGHKFPSLKLSINFFLNGLHPSKNKDLISIIITASVWVVELNLNPLQTSVVV